MGLKRMTDYSGFWGSDEKEGDEEGEEDEVKEVEV